MPATGLISGMPTSAAASTFTVTATDSAGVTTSRSYGVTINAAIAVNPASLPNGTVGTAYTQTLFGHRRQRVVHLQHFQRQPACRARAECRDRQHQRNTDDGRDEQLHGDGDRWPRRDRLARLHRGRRRGDHHARIDDPRQRRRGQSVHPGDRRQRRRRALCLFDHGRAASNGRRAESDDRGFRRNADRARHLLVHGARCRCERSVGRLCAIDRRRTSARSEPGSDGAWHRRRTDVGGRPIRLCADPECRGTRAHAAPWPGSLLAAVRRRYQRSLGARERRRPISQATERMRPRHRRMPSRRSASAATARSPSGWAATSTSASCAPARQRTGATSRRPASPSVPIRR